MISKEKNKTKNIQVIDLARSFSILAVMAGHFNGFPTPEQPWASFWIRLQHNNTYGVCVFFVISGFLITRLIDQNGGGIFRPRFKEFYVRREARLFPLLAVTIFLGIIFTFVFPEHSMKYLYCFKTLETKFNSLFWISICTYFYNWFQVLSSKNIPGIYWGVLWSLSVEEQFYIFYPPLLKHLGGGKNFRFYISGVILLGFLWRFGVFLSGSDQPSSSVKSSFGAFDQIAFVCLLYWVNRTLDGFFVKHHGLSLLICLSGIFIVVQTYFGTDAQSILDLVYAPTLIALGSFLFLLG